MHLQSSTYTRSCVKTLKKANPPLEFPIFSGHLRCIPSSRNTQPLREPAISLPLPVPLVPMAVEFGDLPALGFGRGECVLHIAEGYYEPMARCRNCQGWISGVSC